MSKFFLEHIQPHQNDYPLVMKYFENCDISEIRSMESDSIVFLADHRDRIQMANFVEDVLFPEIIHKIPDDRHFTDSEDDETEHWTMCIDRVLTPSNGVLDLSSKILPIWLSNMTYKDDSLVPMKHVSSFISQNKEMYENVECIKIEESNIGDQDFIEISKWGEFFPNCKRVEVSKNRVNGFNDKVKKDVITAFEKFGEWKSLEYVNIVKNSITEDVKMLLNDFLPDGCVRKKVKWAVDGADVNMLSKLS